MKIAQCPTCGSDRIKKVHRQWSGEFEGRSYRVEDLEFYECPQCGERVFDPAAMRKIEARSPAYRAAHKIKRPA